MMINKFLVTVNMLILIEDIILAMLINKSMLVVKKYFKIYLIILFKFSLDCNR